MSTCLDSVSCLDTSLECIWLARRDCGWLECLMHGLSCASAYMSVWHLLCHRFYSVPLIVCVANREVSVQFPYSSMS